MVQNIIILFNQQLGFLNETPKLEPFKPRQRRLRWSDSPRMFQGTYILFV